MYADKLSPDFIVLRALYRATATAAGRGKKENSFAVFLPSHTLLYTLFFPLFIYFFPPPPPQSFRLYFFPPTPARNVRIDLPLFPTAAAAPPPPEYR